MPKLVILLGSVLICVLVLLGIGGIAFHLFRDDGWLAQLLGAIWNAQYEAPLITVVLILGAIGVLKFLHTVQIGGKRESRVPDFVLFAFIAMGIFFLGRLVTTGQI